MNAIESMADEHKFQKTSIQVLLLWASELAVKAVLHVKGESIHKGGKDKGESKSNTISFSEAMKRFVCSERMENERSNTLLKAPSLYNELKHEGCSNVSYEEKIHILTETDKLIREDCMKTLSTEFVVNYKNEEGKDI